MAIMNSSATDSIEGLNGGGRWSRYYCMSERLKCILLSMLCSFYASCGNTEVTEETKSPTAPRLVGRIASIHTEDGFALIEGFGDAVLTEGLLLSSRGENERSATMTVSGERMGRFTAADVKNGDIEVGDAVYARRITSEGSGAEAEFTEDPKPDSGQTP